MVKSIIIGFLIGKAETRLWQEIGDREISRLISNLPNAYVGKPQATPTLAQGLGQSSGGLPTWGKWLIVAGIAVAAAAGFESLTGDSELPASPT